MTAVDGVAARLAEQVCSVNCPDVQPTLLPVYDTGDERDQVRACYQCQRKVAALLPVFEAELDKQAREKAAEELEAIAEALRSQGVGPEVFVVDDRASALRGEGR